ncbi:MAG: wax ester/triacylglycerol synthase family O-acyltransferase [Burkholderiaceae bacterium]|jgi:WS/DGAT/MGAT family acyltransferase
MKHLSGLDATFLHLETPEMPMHVGGLNLFELPEDYRGDFYEDVKAHVQKRMHLAPVFQRKLATMPFELANPVWVDDEYVDLDYHIRRIVLKEGTRETLEQYVGRLHSSLLDRSRPLWEFYVIEGLEGGRVAFYSKVHHAGLDGAAGMALANAILDLSPEPRAIKLPREKRRTNQYQLGVAELFGAALSNTVSQWVKIAKLAPPAAKVLGGLLLPQRDAKGERKPSFLKELRIGPRTPLNVAITNQRAFATLSIPLEEAKQISKRTGTTLNDVVLAHCAGALRRYLADYDGIPKRPLVAGVPVSLREAGNTEMNNQVSMMLVSLATDIKDPLERLAAIHASSTKAKNLTGDLKTITPTDFPSFGAPWLVSGLVSLYGRSKLANVLPPLANVAISNVPGPQFPLYMAGAKMLTYYPVSIPGHGIALNITVQSYNGSLEYGLTACRRAVPDVKDLAGYVAEAHRELLARALEIELPPASLVAEKPRAKAARNGAARKTKSAPGRKPRQPAHPAEGRNGAQPRTR